MEEPRPQAAGLELPAALPGAAGVALPVGAATAAPRMSLVLDAPQERRAAQKTRAPVLRAAEQAAPERAVRRPSARDARRFRNGQQAA